MGTHLSVCTFSGYNVNPSLQKDALTMRSRLLNTLQQIIWSSKMSKISSAIWLSRGQNSLEDPWAKDVCPPLQRSSAHVHVPFMETATIRNAIPVGGLSASCCSGVLPNIRSSHRNLQEKEKKTTLRLPRFNHHLKARSNPWIAKVLLLFQSLYL